MKGISALYEFIDVAAKNRKYSKNTAAGLKSALKLFEKELNDEEKNSVSKFESELDNIFLNVSDSNKTKYNASSLATYKSRVQKVLNEYNTYGTDSTKMNSWNARRRNTTSNTKKPESRVQTDETLETLEPFAESSSKDSSNVHKISLSLRPDTEFLIVVPRDITKMEAGVIKSILDSLDGGGVVKE